MALDALLPALTTGAVALTIAAISATRAWWRGRRTDRLDQRRLEQGDAHATAEIAASLIAQCTYWQGQAVAAQQDAAARERKALDQAAFWQREAQEWRAKFWAHKDAADLALAPLADASAPPPEITP